MVRPSIEAKANLKELRDAVVDIMLDMPVWADAPIEELRDIPLGVLRKNATQRHGVTRWKRGVNLNQMRVSDVDVIDLHPRLLDEEWRPYGAFVLHHEYIHALGLREHNKLFRQLEAAWPGSTAGRQGPLFTEALRRARAVWLWSCTTCGQEFPRQKPSKRRYRCRKCNTVLIDKKNPVLL